MPAVAKITPFDDGGRRLSTYLRTLFPVEMAEGELIYSQKHSVWHGVVEITPATAAKILEDCRPDWQRKLRPVAAEKYIRDIRAGDWMLNGEAIVLTRALELANGQHRLYAVAQADEPIVTAIMVGVSDDAFALYDQHNARTLAIALQQHGEKDAKTLGSAIKHLWLYRQGGLYSRAGYPTQREGLQLLAENPTLRKSLQMGRRAQQRRVAGGVLAFLHYAFAEKDPRLADWFFERIATQTDLQTGSPVLALWARLDAISRDEDRAGRVSEQMLIGLIVKAWNATRKGKRMKRLTIRDTETLPEIE